MENGLINGVWHVGTKASVDVIVYFPAMPSSSSSTDSLVAFLVVNL